MRRIYSPHSVAAIVSELSTQGVDASETLDGTGLDRPQLEAHTTQISYRQLDTVISTAEALPRIVDAVAGRAEVYADGGIRRGTDVLKALALGARAVLIGRPYLWGLAVNGEAGVRHVLELLRDELALAMMLTGRPTVASLGRDLVA